MKSIFEIAVIGKGMIGTATAKYLAKANHDVLLIGPNEPAQGTDALVYASHYDAARICRRVGSDHGWTQLNLQSLAAFPEIEQESGINFHCPVSCLYVSEYPDDPCLTIWAGNWQPIFLSLPDLSTAGRISIRNIRCLFFRMG